MTDYLDSLLAQTHPEPGPAVSARATPLEDLVVPQDEPQDPFAVLPAPPAPSVEAAPAPDAAAHAPSPPTDPVPAAREQDRLADAPSRTVANPPAPASSRQGSSPPVSREGDSRVPVAGQSSVAPASAGALPPPAPMPDVDDHTDQIARVPKPKTMPSPETPTARRATPPPAEDPAVLAREVRAWVAEPVPQAEPPPMHAPVEMRDTPTTAPLPSRPVPERVQARQQSGALERPVEVSVGTIHVTVEAPPATERPIPPLARRNPPAPSPAPSPLRWQRRYLRP